MLHFDEARSAAIRRLESILEHAPRSTKAVLIDDLFGGLRLILWGGQKKDAEALRADIDRELEKACGSYWTHDVWLATGGGKLSEADRKLYEGAWKDAQPRSHRLRVLDRHRNRGAWFQAPSEPPWEGPRSGTEPRHPPIAVFYSFKGGVGRSTALASFAIQRARQGERIVAIDADLDAPGLGHLLSATGGETAPWGVVDYLLEKPRGEVDLSDYYHACRRNAVTGSGEILVFPAGRINADYLDKLARVDLEPSSSAAMHPLPQLLEEIRSDLRPDWILADTRAGLADPAGMLLGGLAHLHVLFGTLSEQSWQGLRLVLGRLGRDRVHRGKAQADSLLVHAMVPESVEVSEKTRQTFTDRAREEFSQLYYAEDPDDKSAQDDYWSVGDAESRDAPHVPIPLSYSSRLADFRAIDSVADHLAQSPEYRHLASRIGDRFGVEA